MAVTKADLRCAAHNGIRQYCKSYSDGTQITHQWLIQATQKNTFNQFRTRPDLRYIWPMVVKELVVMSTSAVDSEYLALEAILLDYVERYGLTPAARQFFADQALNSAQKPALAPIPFRARRSA